MLLDGWGSVMMDTDGWVDGGVDGVQMVSGMDRSEGRRMVSLAVSTLAG